MMWSRRTWLMGAGSAVGMMCLGSKATADPALPDISVYADLPEINDVSISPDGRHIAMATNLNGEGTVQVINLKDQSSAVFELGKKKIRSVLFGSNMHIVVLTSVTADRVLDEKMEYFRAQTFNIETGAEKLIFDRPNRDIWSSYVTDIKRISVDSTYQLLARQTFLYTIDPETNTETILDREDVYTYRNGIMYGAEKDWIVTPKGRLLARSVYSQDDVWTLEWRDGKKWKKVYSRKERLDIPELIGLGRSDNTIIVSLPTEDGGANYHEIGPDGVLSEPLNAGRLNTSPLFHPTTGLFCGFAEFNDDIRYDFDDPRMRKIADQCKAALPGHRVTICEFAAEDPRKVVLLAEGANESGTYYFVDFSSGQFSELGSKYPDLVADWMAVRTPVSYTAADGLTIHGYLTIPPKAVLSDPQTARNLPLIVVPHGGPQSRDTISFDWESQLYASRGYAVLQPNFRGSTGYGLPFLAAGYGEWGRKMQTDLSDGVRYLASQGLIDPKRVAIVGASYGGYAALAGATLDTGVYRCAVSIAGVSDLTVLVNRGLPESMDDGTSLYWKRFLGDLSTLKDRSPVYQAKRCDIPVLLIHGKDDTVVSIDHSRRMNRALKWAGKTATLIELDGEDHWQSNAEKRQEMAEAILDFLKAHNPA